MVSPFVLCRLAGGFRSSVYRIPQKKLKVKKNFSKNFSSHKPFCFSDLRQCSLAMAFASVMSAAREAILEM